MGSGKAPGAFKLGFCRRSRSLPGTQGQKCFPHIHSLILTHSYLLPPASLFSSPCAFLFLSFLSLSLFFLLLLRLLLCPTFSSPHTFSSCSAFFPSSSSPPCRVPDDATQPGPSPSPNPLHSLQPHWGWEAQLEQVGSLRGPDHCLHSQVHCSIIYNVGKIGK